MVEPIAKPIGLFKAGLSGAGGQFEPLDEKGIRHDIFQRTPVIFGLEINTSIGAPTKDSMIIDFVYDGLCIRDPHASNPMIMSTDYPAETDRGFWYGFCQAPRYTKFSKIGKHTVTIRVAPRPAPAPGTASATQILAPRDFSPAAGGVEATFELVIYPDSQPAIPPE
jgi:hypothetical protein